MNTRALSPFLVSLLLLGSAQPQSVRAEVGVRAVAPAQQDAVLIELSRQLLTRWQMAGELQLEAYRPLILPGENVTLTVLEAPSAPASSMLVRVRLQVEGKAPAVEQTWTLRAQLSREVWVAKALLDRDAALDLTSLETRTVDVLRERDTILVSESLADFVVTRQIQVGRPISWRDVSRRMLVRKGQLIEVAAVDGMLMITMKALAMESGAAGETVRVRNIESRREFSALVVADARAQVRF